MFLFVVVVVVLFLFCFCLFVCFWGVPKGVVIPFKSSESLFGEKKKTFGIITDPTAVEEEKNHITQALATCG